MAAHDAGIDVRDSQADVSLRDRPVRCATMTAQSPASRSAMTVSRAVSLGVGSMVGAGIFALLGEVAAVATSAVWLAFLIGGVVALLNGYSYGRLGARFPSAGGPVEYLTRGFGVGVFSGGLSVFYYAAGVIGMSMVARAFGTYGASLFTTGTPSSAVIGTLAAGLVVGLTLVNLAGAASVGKAELVVVAAKLGVLAVFIVGGATGIQSRLLADEFTISSPGGVLAAVGLAFFAYTGFGVVTNAAADMADPSRDLPRAPRLKRSRNHLEFSADRGNPSALRHELEFKGLRSTALPRWCQNRTRVSSSGWEARPRPERIQHISRPSSSSTGPPSPAA